MSTPVPGMLLTQAEQASDIGSWYISIQAMRQYAFMEASPMLRGLGLLADERTSEENFTVPYAPVQIGRYVDFKDGQRPPARRMQGAKRDGVVSKKAVEGLRITEGDRLANRVNWVASNMAARGRSERLIEDYYGVKALVDGTDATLQPAFDGKAYFAVDHYIDPVAKTGSQKNLLALQLSADNLAAAKRECRNWKAENGEPLFGGFEPEFLLGVPTALEEVAKKICTRGHVAEGGAAVENTQQGTKYYVNPRLTDDKSWYLHITNIGAPLVSRVVFRPMQRRDKGPDSELFRDTSEIEILADEWTAYALISHWAGCLKSTPR